MKTYAGGIRHDYKDEAQNPRRMLNPRWSWFLVGLGLPLLSVVAMLIGGTDGPVLPTTVSPISTAGATARLPLPLPKPSSESDTSANTDSAELGDAELLTLVVGPGDSLDRLFRRNHLKISDLAAMVSVEGAREHLVRLRPGDEINVVHRGGNISSLSREISESQTLHLERRQTGFEATTSEVPIEVRTVGAHGVIETSLFEAAQSAGISDRTIMDMAGIFQWDIDFIQDVRVEDEFTVIYDELWRDGVKLRDGSIVAAEFINQNVSFRAARYKNGAGESGYFTPDGRSVRKAFLRAPVDFTRISSNFNPNRRHPVLNTIRAHRGVDYAARSGTPVRAAGDGKISLRGVNGGYGNTIVLQHGGNITTLYGHLSRFAEAKVGSRVKQGQTIGYVGQSGLATGPHLHYEYRVNGVHRNPRTVTLPPADPVPSEYRDDFQNVTASLWHQLDLYRSTRLAAVSN